jgi:hypothetical protein
MKIGINRSKIKIDVMGTVFEIGIVPLMATQLIVQHDNEEDLDKQIELTFEVVEAILIANGYEFKRSWWEQACDYEMLMEFIVFSMQKDIPPTKGKKKATVEK